MFLQMIRFEWRYYRRQPSFYITSILFFLLAFFATASDNVQIGGGGEVWGNGPFAITRTVTTMLIFSMFLVVNFVSSTALRNHLCLMEELVCTKPVPPLPYQLGRFVGAYLVVLFVFAMVPLGTLLGSLMPWVDQARFGPTVLSYYVDAYLIFALPSLFVLSALFYTIASKFKSMQAMYLVAVVVFVLYLVAGSFAQAPEYRTTAALLDPFGLRSFADVARYWTIVEKNTLSVSFSGVLLQNRLLWLAVGVVLLAVFGGLLKPLALTPKARAGKAKAHSAVPVFAVQRLQTKAQAPSQWAQFCTRLGFELKQVVLSAPFFMLLLICIFNLLAPLFMPQRFYGTADWPLTQTMIELVTESSGLLMVLILTYYCAEVVWRERSQGIGDIIDATPVANMVLWLSKLTAVGVAMLLMYLAFALTTISYQLIKGFDDLDLMQYLVRLGYFNFLPFMLTVVLAFLIQVLSPNKYAGMGIFVVYFIVTQVLDAWGFNHRMWHFAASPASPFSDLNRFGWTLESHSWYMLYWSGLTAILFVLGFGMFQRGPSQSLAVRYQQLRYQIGAGGQAVILFGSLVFVGSGGWIYYNTRVLNQYDTAEQQMDLQADYEKAYKAGADDPILVATKVDATVDIYPAERRVDAEVVQTLVNKFDKPVSKMLVNWPKYTRTMEIIAPGATLSPRDNRLGTAWLEFSTPVQPGETIAMTIKLSRTNPGFQDDDVDVAVVENGTFINNMELLPQFGYSAGFELQERHERSKRGLEPVQRAHKLEDSSRYTESGFGRAEDFIDFSATVSTAAGQTALAPGYLKKHWQQDGRSYFRYEMNAPMFNFYSFLSARLAVKKQDYQGVSLEVYYHPTHHWNVDRMMQSMQDSLDYFNQAFSPYQHQQMRIIEFPGYRDFAQSFANTVPYSEGIGFINDLRNEDSIDMPYYVTAHEMAHQWWGHQVGTANVQGSAVIPETLAQYSALRVMETKYGQAKLRQFLKYELDRYLRGRTEERVAEEPLLRAEGQGYIHYRKGSIVMMAIKDRIGVERLDANLQAFLQEFQYKQNPYPTTLDLLRHLTTGVSSEDKAFIEQQFMQITLYDLRLLEVQKTELPDGQLQLDLTIQAARLSADGKGVETEQVLDEDIDIGAFSADPDEFSADNQLLYLQKHRLKSGKQQVRVVVPKGTTYIGVDPLIKLIDRDAVDNIRKL